MAPKRNELSTIKRLISETDLILSTTPLPENRTARCRELLGTAISLTDNLLKQNKMPAAAILGSKGGSVTAKRGSDYFRKLAARRKTMAAAGHQKKPNGQRPVFEHQTRPNQKLPAEAGNSWLSHKCTKKKPYQRVMKFPTAKGKIVAEVELSISPDYRIIEVIFQDKTSLTFNLESCLQVTPEFVSWKSGSYKPMKRWRPVHSV